jgi:hypothetical protein
MDINIIFCLHFSASFWFDLTNGLPMNEKNQTVLCQQPTKTLKEIQELVKQQSCLILKKEITNDIQKRDINGGNLDIHAIQTTVNDNRVMINYLINNSINATFVADAIETYHSKTGPIFTSWRDLVDLFFIILFLGFFIYFIICRGGFVPCDRLLQCLFKPIIQRLQKQQQQQQTEPSTIIDMDMSRRRNQQQQPQQHTSISGDFGQYNAAHITE